MLTTHREKYCEEDRGTRSSGRPTIDAGARVGQVAAEGGVPLVSHLREIESGAAPGMMTGSVGLTGGVDGALVLDRGRRLPVRGRARHREPDGAGPRFDAHTGRWAIAGDTGRRRTVIANGWHKPLTAVGSITVMVCSYYYGGAVFGGDRLRSRSSTPYPAGGLGPAALLAWVLW